MDRLSDQQIGSVFRKAVQTKGLINDQDTSIIFYDLSFLNLRIQEIKKQFPETALHAVAVKANPLARILEKVASLDVGLEVATLPELYLALRANVPPERIVFDSPTKTKEELDYAINVGIHINADSLAELMRIEARLSGRPPKGSIGVRVNPQVGSGTILSTSVAENYSKFGVPLNEQWSELRDVFIRCDWLSGIHLHIGSQGCSMAMLLDGVERVLAFVRDVNSALQASGKSTRIKIIDLGGGLPVSYRDQEFAPSMSDYRGALGERFPELFSGEFRIFTEFGRYVYANTGWVASRVEYVKSGPSVKTAMIHVGADMFLRECYNPQDWHHDISVVDAKGECRVGLDSLDYMIAGPLCFAGDVIARGIKLPVIEPGDHLIIHDTGAYTLSMWSRYNSRQIPKVLGYYDDGSDFETLKPREDVESVLRFWA
jgi:diaminopimelate decarboxylase